MKSNADDPARQRRHRRFNLLQRNQLLMLGSYLSARGDGLDDAAVMLCDLDDAWAREFTRECLRRACPE